MTIIHSFRMASLENRCRNIACVASSHGTHGETRLCAECLKPWYIYFGAGKRHNLNQEGAIKQQVIEHHCGWAEAAMSRRLSNPHHYSYHSPGGHGSSGEEGFRSPRPQYQSSPRPYGHNRGGHKGFIGHQNHGYSSVFLPFVIGKGPQPWLEFSMKCCHIVGLLLKKSRHIGLLYPWVLFFHYLSTWFCRPTIFRQCTFLKLDY